MDLGLGSWVMGWDSECSFLSAIPLFLGHKINLEFGCSGWEPEYSSVGKEPFFLLKPWTSNSEFQTLGPKPEPVTKFSLLFILILSHIIRTPSLPFGGQSSNSRITVGSVPRTAALVGAPSEIGKATLTHLVALKAQIKVYVVGRNAAKQHTFTNQLRKSNNRADLDFLEGEVSLMAKEKRMCNEIKAKSSRLYAVSLSTGYIPGVDRKVCLSF
jgi:hypothetical protein